MRQTYTHLFCGLLLIVGQASPDSAAAQIGCRKTLLQWSYGTSFGGGADLSEPLVTDRPDFTESASVVGCGVVQLEAGYTYTYDSTSTTSSHEQTYPETLLRVGLLAEWMEFRLDWTYNDVRETAFGGAISHTSGSEDISVGVKLALTPQECMLPETALILQSGVPTGATELTADDVLPGITYIYSWALTDYCTTAGQTQLNRAKDEVTDEPYLEFSQSWTAGFGLTEAVGSYIEWFVLAPDGADTNHTESYLDGGFTYLVTDNLQLDVRGGVGLNQAADDYFVGTGFAVRR